jgi:ArsR family transcriptional regulator, arsenate/arsenite/antimonite-responsive transcriptional repressor
VCSRKARATSPLSFLLGCASRGGGFATRTPVRSSGLDAGVGVPGARVHGRLHSSAAPLLDSHDLGRVALHAVVLQFLDQRVFGRSVRGPRLLGAAGGAGFAGFRFGKSAFGKFAVERLADLGGLRVHDFDVRDAPIVREPLGEAAAADLARMFKALSDPVRLRLLSLIASYDGGQACVCDLTGPFDVSQPTISHHLKVLRQAGLVDSGRRGT